MWPPASVSPLVRQVRPGDAVGLGGVRESCRAHPVGLLPWRGLSCLKARSGGCFAWGGRVLGWDSAGISFRGAGGRWRGDEAGPGRPWHRCGGR